MFKAFGNIPLNRRFVDMEKPFTKIEFEVLISE